MNTDSPSNLPLVTRPADRWGWGALRATVNQVEVFEEIDAPPSIVWDVLCQFEAYPEWNPFVRAIEGVPEPGESFRVRLDPPGGKPRTIRVDLVAIEEGKRLAWHAERVVPFVYDGYHEVRLEPLEGNRTRLLHRENVRGALVPVLFDESTTRRGFEAMNRALRDRAESRVAGAV